MFNIKYIFLIILINFLPINCDHNFVIVIPSYNNAQWYKENLDSVFSQSYKKYRVIYTDDCSPDGTAQLVENYIKKNNIQNKIELIKNEKRNLALYNTYHSVKKCKPEEIVVVLDGDDKFSDKNVLKYLNHVYSDKNIWITFGSWLTFPGNSKSKNVVIPPELILTNNIRYIIGLTHAPRTFYAKLFHKVKKEDLKYEGKFFEMNGDLAYMLPMLEMAGFHSKHISKILYIYNRVTPINDNKVNRPLQKYLGDVIRQRPHYSPLKTLF